MGRDFGQGLLQLGYLHGHLAGIYGEAESRDGILAGAAPQVAATLHVGAQVGFGAGA